MAPSSKSASIKTYLEGKRVGMLSAVIDSTRSGNDTGTHQTANKYQARSEVGPAEGSNKVGCKPRNAWAEIPLGVVASIFVHRVNFDSDPR